MVGKNKKVLNKKLLQFVKFNRFESFTKTTILDKFKITDISWASDFKTSDKNKKYFLNENEWVLWKLLKWIFEDYLITVCRCYFYCTEK